MHHEMLIGPHHTFSEISHHTWRLTLSEGPLRDHFYNIPIRMSLVTVTLHYTSTGDDCRSISVQTFIPQLKAYAGFTCLSHPVGQKMPP